MAEISTLIGSLGFPIVACFCLWRFIDTTLKEFSKAMNDNTKMLSKVSDSIDRISGQPEEKGDEENG